MHLGVLLVVGAIVLAVRSKNRARRDGSPNPPPGFATYAQQQPYGNQGRPRTPTSNSPHPRPPRRTSPHPGATPTSGSGTQSSAPDGPAG
ncbi:hypothetical protein [Streptomyces acidicola]|uniref:hypothetical protein n=1 Tax=Streptomyces acidicola TaxID=2596892 RepID=UPI00341D90BB